MQQMDPQRDTSGTQGEGGYESIKIEKNSKGTNFSVRIVKQPGQTWDQVLTELRRVEGELRREYGG